MIEFTPKQQEFANAVFSGKYSYLLYGGAIRGGKTVCAISLIIIFCKIFPGSRWAIVRKDLPTIKRNTMPSFNRIKPSNFVGEVNKTDWYADCKNSSRILFFPESISNDPDLDRWKGLEVNGFLFEEANECSEVSFNKSIERAGSWRCHGEQPPPLILMTCNPAQNWVKRLLYDPWRKGTLEPPFFYLPANANDNPHLDPMYLASLEQLKKINEAAYRRFVLGDWEAADDPDQLIKYEWLMMARTVEKIPGKRGLGVDVARYGDDDTVLAHLNGNAIVRMEYHHGLSLERTTALVRSRIVDIPIDADQVMIDGVGIGAGVVDNLKADGYKVNDLISGARPIEPKKHVNEATIQFKNLRSQMWWYTRERFRQGLICLDIDDARLREDLSAPRYTITSDRVVTVESKDQIKKRIGRSTDAGDAVVYAIARDIHLSKLERFRRKAWGSKQKNPRS